jgi:imidazolonepropionase
MEGLPKRGAISDSELVIIEDGGVIVEKDKITEIGLFSELRNKHKEITHHIDYPCVLLPGFIDSHTHLCFDGTRSDEYAKRNSCKSYQ